VFQKLDTVNVVITILVEFHLFGAKKMEIYFFLEKECYDSPLWRGVGVIGTEDFGFESRQGVRFLGLNTLQYCPLYLNSQCYCVYVFELKAF
jgi:hypothetical protein